MQQRLAGIINRRHKNGDDGFSLIELVIAMAIIGGVLLALITLQTKAMVTIAQSKERQQATAVANRVLEEIRSLPWNVISNGGAPGSIPSDDPYVSAGKLTIPGEPISGETVVLTGYEDGPTGEVFKASPLYGEQGSNVTLHHDAAQEREFKARSYVTAPQGADGPLNLVVVVEWKLNSSSERRNVVARTTIFNTKSGCGSAENLPYATACQDFYTANSSISGATISIAGHTEIDSEEPQADEILFSSGLNLVSVSGPSASVNIDSAQATSVNATGTRGAGLIIDSANDEAWVENADGSTSRASNSVTSSVDRDTSGSKGSLSLNVPDINGDGVKLSVRTSSRSSQSLANTTNACESWANADQPCGIGAASTSGKDTVELIAGGETVKLLEVSSANPKAIAGRFPGGIPVPGTLGLCIEATGSGCAQAYFEQSSLDINFPGVAQVKHTVKGGAAIGTSSGDRRAFADRNGSVATSWAGGPAGGITDGEKSGQTTELFEVYTEGGVKIEATASITIDKVRTELREPNEDCQGEACAARAEIPATEVSVRYLITVEGNTSEFTITVNGGSARASVDYTAAPEAWESE